MPRKAPRAFGNFLLFLITALCCVWARILYRSSTHGWASEGHVDLSSRSRYRAGGGLGILSKIEVKNFVYIGRHASRYATNRKSCGAVEEAVAGKVDWGCPASEAAKYDSITEVGKDEALGIGKRLHAALNFTKFIEKIPKILTTAKRRTQQTAEYFFKGAGISVKKSDFQYSPLDSDNKLRFFDTCGAYNSLWEAKQPHQVPELTKFEETILAEVIEGFNERNNGVLGRQLNRKQIEAVQKECGYKWVLEDAAERREEDRVLCELMTKKEFEAFSWYKDVKEYYKKGPGSDPFKGISISCGTVRHLLTDLASTTPSFAFAHAETLVPIYSLLRLHPHPPIPAKEPSPEHSDDTFWRLYRTCPMASNILLVLTTTDHVMIFHDESPVKWGIACIGEHLCPLEKVKEAVHQIPCDWDEMCSG